MTGSLSPHLPTPPSPDLLRSYVVSCTPSGSPRCAITGPGRARALLALAGLLILLRGCAQGRPVPLRLTPAQGASLLGWEELRSEAGRVVLAMRLRGPGSVRVLVDGRPVLGCLHRPLTSPAAASDEATAARADETEHRLMRCELSGLRDGDHRILVSTVWDEPLVAPRRRGLGLERPRPGSRVGVPGGWWAPGGWQGPWKQEEALLFRAVWLRVGPADLREGILLQGEAPARLGSVERSGGVDQAVLARAVRWDPRVGRAILAFLRHELDAPALGRALMEWHSELPRGPLAQGNGPVPAHGLRGARRVGDEPLLHDPLLRRLAWTILLGVGGVPLLSASDLVRDDRGVLRWLVATRRAHRALSLGRFELLRARGDLLAFLKVLLGPGQAVEDLALVVVNRGATAARLQVPLPAELTRCAELREAWDARLLDLVGPGLLMDVPAQGIRLVVAGLP